LNVKGLCLQNNPLCKTSDLNNGGCLTCYPGYVVSAGNCTLGNSPTTSSDPNCKSTDSSGVCNSCYSGYYLNAGKSCQRLDPLCKNYTNSQSSCGACYDGYTLYNGQCLVSTELPSQNSDPYCIKTQATACITCASGYYLGQNGICAGINPLCKTSDLTNGACLDCYPGYVISANTCIVAAAVYIPNCDTVTGNICGTCITGYFPKNGGCEAVSLLCGTYDDRTGVCLSCTSGYVFQAGQCIYPSMGIDLNCIYYTGPYCSQCANGYALINYICGSIDPNCLQFDSATNSCKQCTTGKIPMGPSCVWFEYWLFILIYIVIYVNGWNITW